MRLDLPAGHGGPLRAGRDQDGAARGPGRASARSTAAAAWSSGQLDDPDGPQAAWSGCRQAASATSRPSDRADPRGASLEAQRRMSMSRSARTAPAYAGHYGPTVGDRIRLADTELIIEIEKDFTVYGEEVAVRRRQGHPRQPGTVAVAATPSSRRTRPGHHQRRRPRLLGHRQGRHRHPRRPHRRASARRAIR